MELMLSSSSINSSITEIDIKPLRESPPEDHPTISEGRREKNFFFRFDCLK